MIIIVDYGLGNLGSIYNMLKKIGAEAEISSDPARILEAGKLLLPGVGAFDNGMKNLEELGLISVLEKKVISEKTPLLGICLGMQLLTKRSEEGAREGLGWIDAETVKFNFTGTEGKLKVPNMGWNHVQVVKESKLMKDMYPEPRFYFVHSYHVKCNDPEDELLKSDYGFGYTSGFERDNIIGVQFHPEKSHKYGMKLLQNFADNY